MADRSLVDTLVGPVAPGRVCGDCVACCKLLSINAPTLTKPAGQLCQHNSGAACQIYESRPEVCRGWYCAWRRIPSMPDAARPDRLGVMIYLERPANPPNILRKLYLRARALEGGSDFDTPLAREAIAMMREGPLPVWLEHAGIVRLAHPDDAIGHVLVNGAASATPEIAAGAAMWRRQLDAFRIV